MSQAISVSAKVAPATNQQASIEPPSRSCPLSLRCLKIAKEAFKILTSALAGGAAGYYSYAAYSATAIVAVAALSCALIAIGIQYAVSKMEEKELRSQKISAFCNLLMDRVKACILHNSQFSQKDEIINLLNEIKKHHRIVQNGSDDIRVKFVGSQGAIEHVLACSQALQEIGSLVGAIHTPLPATPLCTSVKGDFLKTLLDPSIIHDLDKLLTVKSRAEIVREYLEKEGNLYVVYPQGGLEKRTANEREVYQEALTRYKGKLFDTVLDCIEMSPDMVGATYLFKDKENNIYCFSIKARQANDIQPRAEWGIWLGPITEPLIKQRVDLIFDYIKSQKGPDIRAQHAI